MNFKKFYLTACFALLMLFSGNLFAQIEGEENDEAEEIVDMDERQELQDDANKALEAFKAKEMSVQEYLNSAAGYAVFPNVGKGAWILGGAAGNGVVYEGEEVVGYAELRQVDVGFQIGGQAFREIIIFKTQEALDEFKDGNFEFEGSASAVIWDEGKGKAIQFQDDVGVAVMPKAGAMAGISVGGQKFNYGAIDQ